MKTQTGWSAKGGTVKRRGTNVRPTSWEEIERKHFSPGIVARVRREVDRAVLEVNLSAIAKIAGKTRKELAATRRATASSSSTSPGQRDLHLSTLRAVVEALGGEVEIRARFGDKTVRLIAV